MSKYALLVGLTEVDPKAYQGWNGKSGCEGCEVDVKNIHKILSRYNFTSPSVSSLLTANATRENLLTNLKKAADTCKAGDVFVFYYSGHGGQVADINSEEPDKKDETLVCYDGEVIDDDLNKIWVTFREGVRIVMLTDCCNSETNFRSLRINQRDSEDSNLQNIAKHLEEESAMKAMLIHIGACSDGASAAGFKRGGLFTQTIKKILSGESFQGNYESLVSEILTRTGDFDQKANYHEYGPTESKEFELFRNGKLFADTTRPSLAIASRVTLFAQSIQAKRHSAQEKSGQLLDLNPQPDQKAAVARRLH